MGLLGLLIHSPPPFCAFLHVGFFFGKHLVRGWSSHSFCALDLDISPSGLLIGSSPLWNCDLMYIWALDLRLMCRLTS